MKKKCMIAFAGLVVLLCVGIPFLQFERTISPEVASAAQSTEQTAPEKDKNLKGMQKIDGKYYYYVKAKHLPTPING